MSLIPKGRFLAAAGKLYDRVKDTGNRGVFFRVGWRGREGPRTPIYKAEHIEFEGPFLTEAAAWVGVDEDDTFEMIWVPLSEMVLY